MNRGQLAIFSVLLCIMGCVFMLVFWGTETPHRVTEMLPALLFAIVSFGAGAVVALSYVLSRRQ